MNILASLLFFAFLPSTLRAQESVTLKYDDLPKLIQTHSKDVKAAKIFMEASASKRSYVERSRYPRLDIESGLRGVTEVDGSGNSAPYLKLEGSVSLYRGRRDAIKDVVQAKEAAIRNEDTQLIYRSQLSFARNYFVRLASVRELKLVWVEAVKTAEQKRKSVQVKVRAGLSTNTDLLEFDLFESSLKREKRSLDKDEHEYSNKLRMALGLKDTTEIVLDKTFAHPIEPIESQYALAVNSHPAVRKLGLKADQARAAAESSSGKWSPDLSLFASYEAYLQKDGDIPGALPRRDMVTGIRLSFPMSDSLSLENESSAMRLEASAYELQKQQNEKEIEMAFHEHLHDLQILHEFIHDSDAQIKKARKYLKQVNEEYDRGIKNGSDVLEAARTLYQSQMENIQLRFDYYLAEVGISNISGV